MSNISAPGAKPTFKSAQTIADLKTVISERLNNAIHASHDMVGENFEIRVYGPGFDTGRGNVLCDTNLLVGVEDFIAEFRDELKVAEDAVSSAKKTDQKSVEMGQVARLKQLALESVLNKARCQITLWYADKDGVATQQLDAIATGCIARLKHDEQYGYSMSFIKLSELKVARAKKGNFSL